MEISSALEEAESESVLFSLEESSVILAALSEDASTAGSCESVFSSVVFSAVCEVVSTVESAGSELSVVVSELLLEFCVSVCSPLFVSENFFSSWGGKRPALPEHAPQWTNQTIHLLVTYHSLSLLPDPK